MGQYSYAIDNGGVLVEISENGKPVDVVIDNITFVDDLPYMTGTYSLNFGDEVKQIVIPLDPAEVPDLGNMMNKQRQAILNEGWVEKAIAERQGDRVLSAGEAFDDMDGAIQEAGAKRIGAPAVIDAPQVPDEVATQTRAAQDPISMRDPVLIPYEIDGAKGDLVLHEIEFAGDKPFMSGTYTVDTPTGSQTREFVLEIDKSTIAEFEGLSDVEIQGRLNEGKLDEMIASSEHEFIFSRGESFPDRARLISDIDKLDDMGEGADHIRLLAAMGQEHPEFVGNLDRYLNNGMGSDQSIKLATLDAVGITDIAQRERLVYGSDNLDDFVKRVSANVDLGFNETSKILDAIAQQSNEMMRAAELARGADVASGVADLSRAAKAARMGANIPAVGVAAGIAGAVMTGAANAGQRDYADQLAEQGVISHEALAAYKDLSGTLEAMMQADNAVSTVDPTGISIISTIGLEMKAREDFEEWVDKYAPNLTADAIDALSPSLLSTESAQMSMLGEAVDNIPTTIEGVPQGLHALIEASNDYKGAQQDLEDSVRGKPRMSAEENQIFLELAVKRDTASDNLMKTMEECLSDQDNIRDFMELLPVEDRLEFLRRLADSDPNPEVLAALHPEVSAYVAAYENSGLGYYFVGLEEEEFLKENMDLVTDYIMQRSGLTAIPSPDLEGIRTTIGHYLASGGMPEDAPPELQALAEMQGNEAMQESYFKDLVDDGTAIIAQAFIEGNQPAVIESPSQEITLAAAEMKTQFAPI